jgi:Tfp pilus assembly protein PilF
VTTVRGGKPGASTGPCAARPLRRWFSVAISLVALGTGVAACGGGSGSTHSPDSKANYTTLVGAGMALLREGNVNAAQQLFEQAVAKDPEGPVAYYDLGVSYQQQGESAVATRMYRRAIRGDPRYVPALYNLAVILGQRNRPLAVQTAMFYYRRIIQLQPDSPTAYFNLGLLEITKNALRAHALRDLSRAFKLEPALRDRVPAALRATALGGAQS